MVSRRIPHRPFDAELARVLFGGRPVRSHELLTDGACNTNFKVTLEDGSYYVLRMYARGSPDVERTAMELVSDTVPVPEILESGPDWAVMRFLPGVALHRSPEATEDAARVLASISRVTLPGPGKLKPDGTIAPYRFGGFEGFIREALDKSEVQRWLGMEILGKLETLLDRERSRYGELDAEHQLVHGDYNSGNILTEDGSVSGVLDWEFALSGTPYMDIGNLLRHLGPDHDEAVARGVRSGGMRLPLDWRRRAALADLASHLEFLTSGHDDAFKRACVERVHGLLDS